MKDKDNTGGHPGRKSMAPRQNSINRKRPSASRTDTTIENNYHPLALKIPDEEKHHIIADYVYAWECWMGPDMQLLYSSHSSERIFGYSSSDFLNDPGLFEKIIYPDDRLLFVNHLSECNEASTFKSEEFEFRIISKNGDVVWLMHRCQPVFLSDGLYAGRRAGNSDITRRKYIEQELRSSERQLKAILEAITETVFLMDVDGRLIISNRTAAERLGTDPEGLKKKNMFDWVPPDVAEKRREQIRKVIKIRESLQFEDERFGRTIIHSIYPVVENNGEVRYLAVFGRDITEQKRMENLLYENEERYRLFFRTIMQSC